jgi:hypothetical protein
MNCGTKVRGASYARALLRRTAMANLRISDLLLLTCCGAFIASVTYAVKLSIEAF